LARFRRQISKKRCGMRVERVGDSAEYRHGRISFSALYRPKVAKVESGADRELLLRESARLAEFPDRDPYDVFPRHIWNGALVRIESLGRICPPVYGAETTDA
jgi:hypothetical protein